MIFLVEARNKQDGEILLRRIKEQYELSSDICPSIPESVPRRRGRVHECWFDDLPAPEDCREIALLVVHGVKPEGDRYDDKTMTERLKTLKKLYGNMVDVAVTVFDFYLKAYKRPSPFVGEFDSAWFSEFDLLDERFVQFVPDTAHLERRWWFYVSTSTPTRWEITTDLNYDDKW